MKNKYQRMNKLEKGLIKQNYYNTEAGKNMKNRLDRLIVIGIIGLCFSAFLIYSNITSDGNNIWQYILSGILTISSCIFLIGSYKIRIKVLNKYALKNSK